MRQTPLVGTPACRYPQPVQFVAEQPPALASVGLSRSFGLRPLLVHEMALGERHREQTDKPPDAIRSGQMRNLQIDTSGPQRRKRVSTSQRCWRSAWPRVGRGWGCSTRKRSLSGSVSLPIRLTMTCASTNARSPPLAYATRRLGFRRW